MQIVTAMAGGGTFFERFTNLLISFDIDSKGFGSEACTKWVCTHTHIYSETTGLRFYKITNC